MIHAPRVVLFSTHRDVDWRRLFGNDRPVEIEVGCGKGAFLLAYAEQRPDRNLLGIEKQPRWVRWIERRLERSPRENARVLCADAAFVLASFVPDASVHAIHLYFPDPWWKRRHHKRRIVRADLAGHLFRALEPGGALHLATDVADRFETMTAELAPAGFAITVSAEPTPTGRPLTNFERKYRAEGRPLHYAMLVKPAR